MKKGVAPWIYSVHFLFYCTVMLLLNNKIRDTIEVFHSLNSTEEREKNIIFNVRFEGDASLFSILALFGILLVIA